MLAQTVQNLDENVVSLFGSINPKQYVRQSLKRTNDYPKLLLGVFLLAFNCCVVFVFNDLLTFFPSI
jgi:hypothetical protein